MGYVEGLFVATEDDISNALGKEVYFGEILGKHSEIFGTLEKKDLELIDIDSETVEKIGKYFDGKTWVGYNPLDYIE